MFVISSHTWDIVLKCKSVKYKTIEDALKHIWTENYGNQLKYYNVNDMICIINDVLFELYPPERRARIFDRIMGQMSRFETKEDLLEELFAEVALSKIRKTDINRQLQDIYQIKFDGKLYTIKEYDNICHTV